MQETRTERFKRHIGYGVGYFPDACYYNFLSTYQLLFLTSIVGMDAGRAGTIISTTIMADAVFSILVGRFSDNLRGRFGRRRPLILFGAFAMPISFMACYYNFQADPAAQTAYYITFGFLYWMSFAVFFVSFLALGADVATDYEDRIRMISTSRIFSVSGDLIGSAAPLAVIAFLVQSGLSESSAWFTFVAALSSLVFAGIMICWNSTRGRERIVTTPPEKQGLLSTLKDYSELLHLRPYRLLIYAKIAISFSYTTYTACMVFYVVYRMGISATFISPLYIITNLIKMGFIVVIAKGALRYGKKELLVVSTAGTGILALFFVLRGIDSKMEMYVYVLACVYAQAAFWQLCNTNFYDVTDLDEYRFGKRREGNLMALQSLLSVAAISLTLRLVTGLLDFSGFDGTLAAQSAGALAMLERIFILFPAVGMLSCAFFLSRYKVNKAGFALLSQQLYRREQGLDPLPQEDLDKIEYMFR
ncbi:MAG: MFS transporter [Bacillota bacterium]|nr:MFS transporter [Eubacteriales bacterium]MDD4286287.1 MFS transporter [Eubacteriales bacterium]MDI9492027.1 MFS transporter [Bacillota bacterium]